MGKDGDGDGGDALHKYFVSMQEQNNNLFYVLDEGFCVRNVF